jgi:hypothetical protein
VNSLPPQRQKTIVDKNKSKITFRNPNQTNEQQQQQQQIVIEKH